MTKYYGKQSCFVLLLVFIFAVLGCGVSPAPKPESGPAGKPAEDKTNPPLTERFKSPPTGFYDLENFAGIIFDGISKDDWPKAQNSLTNLQTTWQQMKPNASEIKGVKESDEALGRLKESIDKQKSGESYTNLIKFMGSVGGLGKSYKLSPIADLIALGNAVRNVSYYVGEKDWLKAGAKAKELDDIWGRVKPSLEQIGILGEITKTHSYVKQLRDAVAAENKSAAEDRIADLNKSLGQIREYYRGR